jgi:glycolate oxidase FAD binding subunit
VRDVRPFADAAHGQRLLWRVSTAPTAGPQVAARIAATVDAAVLYDWAGGLVWIELLPSDDAHAPLVRAAVAAAGGHATLIRAPASVRAAVAVFEPQDPVLAALTRRVKEGFDPKGVLNPGRMYAGV